MKKNVVFCFQLLPLILSCKEEGEKRNNKGRPEKARFGRDLLWSRLKVGGSGAVLTPAPSLEHPLPGIGNLVGQDADWRLPGAEVGAAGCGPEEGEGTTECSGTTFGCDVLELGCSGGCVAP